MKIPLEYNARSLLLRPVSTLLTALGIALVVAVFIGMLALANGFRAALVKTGSPQNVMILRRGADSELSSGIDRQTASILASSPHIANGPDGRPMFSPEVYVIIPLPRANSGSDTTGLANVVVRGISPAAWTVRNNVKIEGGRKP
ncbi:MAG: ABC transporter permease, partial [Gemmatimonadales bacterium]